MFANYHYKYDWKFIFDLNFKQSEIIICDVTKNKDEVKQTKMILVNYFT
jgi:hypothetical protein